MAEDPNWKSWTEMAIREFTQIRVEINRHLDEHRQDILRLTDRMDQMTKDINIIARTIEENQRESDKKQDLAIQKLQIEAESMGKKAGSESAKAVTSEIGAKMKLDGATISVAVTAIIVGAVEAYRLIMLNKP